VLRRIFRLRLKFSSLPPFGCESAPPLSTDRIDAHRFDPVYCFNDLRRVAEKPDAKPRPRAEAIAKDGTGLLTTGKLNAVRAAFKAGVKPSAIARQFGISQSDIRKALATERRDQKSGR